MAPVRVSGQQFLRAFPHGSFRDGRGSGLCASICPRKWDWKEANTAALDRAVRHLVDFVAFSPDGRVLASAGLDNNAIKLWDAQSGALLNTNFIANGHGVAYTPDFRFMTDGDPHAAFAIVKGSDQLPMNDFIAANRRDSLADDIARLQGQ